jgi:hypothetical protein
MRDKMFNECYAVFQRNLYSHQTPRVYSKCNRSQHYKFNDLDKENMDPDSAYVTSAYVTITIGQFVKATGKPIVPTKPGEYIGHVSYKAPHGTEKGGAYWDICRVTKVTERGSLVEFEDFEEVKGSEMQPSVIFEHWRATGETFGAPVNELIVLTCQETITNQQITVETPELKKIADAVEAEADRARRKRSALE